MELALTYDDVLLVPRRSGIATRREVDTTTRLSRRLDVAIPILSANMDTVTEAGMAVARDWYSTVYSVRICSARAA